MIVSKPFNSTAMKRSNSLSFVFAAMLSFYFNVANTQVPDIQWQNTIGGDKYDYVNMIVQADDGSYFIGGTSDSYAFVDKSENPVLSTSSDYWVLKLSPVGDIIWQNTIGGEYNDALAAVCPTPDGGCMLGGYSASYAGGDKTESCKLNGAGERTYDYWLVKLNAGGNIEWQDVIGGKGDDFLSDMKATADGGFIIGGNSNSGVSGDKTEVNVGLEGYWVVKLNADFEIEWQNTIDGIYHDLLTSICQTSDGGYLLGGHSNSGLSGEKLEPSFSDSYDYWIIKLNPDGAIEWQNTIGGNGDDYLGSVGEKSDGNYIIGGWSNSNATGDKTENKKGYEDFWIMELDTDGSIVWQNTIGGSQSELYTQIEETPDGGFLLCGTSATNLSADKTVPSFGYNDYWLLKLDALGDIIWQSVYGGSGADIFDSFTQSNDGGILIGGRSNSDISGNKTEDAIYTAGGSDDDLWIIKLEGDTCIPSAEVCNGMDDDCDGEIDEDALVISVSEATDETTFCKGESVPLSVTYFGDCIFQWKRNGNNIPGANSPVYIATRSGLYTCMVITDCGVAISDGISVSAKKKPNASISADGPLVFCPGGSVVLSANAGAGLQYQWFKNSLEIAGATGIDYTATTPGVYTCLVTKATTGCSKISNTATVTTSCKSADDGYSTTENLISLYPNPAGSYVTVEMSEDLNAAFIYIMDVTGKLLNKYPIHGATITIDISGYHPGIYFVRVATLGTQSIGIFEKH